MPAWITSLLRDEVAVPIPSAASRTITSRPACASRRATARPITPAPITTHSTLSIGGASDPELRGGSAQRARLVKLPFVGRQARRRDRSTGADRNEQPVGFASEHPQSG